MESPAQWYATISRRSGEEVVMSDQRPDDPRWLTEPPPPTAVPAEPIVTVGAGTTSEAGSTAGSSAPTTERASHAASEAKEQVKQVGSEAKEQAKQVGSE